MMIREEHPYEALWPAALRDARLRALAFLGVGFGLVLVFIQFQPRDEPGVDIDVRHACKTCRGQVRTIHGMEIIHQFPPGAGDVERVEPDAAAQSKQVSLVDRIEEVSSRISDWIFGKRALWAGETMGVIVFANGCGRSARDFWDSGPGCINCHGLPEEKRMIQSALDHGYTAIAISSPGRGRACWDTQRWDHTEKVAGAVRQWVNDHRLDRDIPFFAYGISSGASFVQLLPRSMNITAIATQGAAIHSALELSNTLGSSYPSMAFLQTEQDSDKGREDAEGVRLLRKNHISVRTFNQNAQPVDPHFFSHRIDGFEEKVSEELVRILEKSGFIDSQGFLTKDPRKSLWRTVVWKEMPTLVEQDTLVPDRSPIVEELNVAWAAREANADYMPQILQFFTEAINASRGDAPGKKYGVRRRLVSPRFSFRLHS